MPPTDATKPDKIVRATAPLDKTALLDYLFVLRRNSNYAVGREDMSNGQKAAITLTLKVINTLIDEVNSGRFDLGVGPGTGVPAPAKKEGEIPTSNPVQVAVPSPEIASGSVLPGS